MARVPFMLLLLLVACGRAGPPGALELIDDTGYRVQLREPARRIVSLVPATTEVLFALGAGAAVVGRTRWCDHPAEVAALPSVGDGMQPSVESIVALAPDLVVAYRSTGNRTAVERLRSLGIPTVELKIDRLEDLDRVTRFLARATAREAAGDSLVAATAAALERATVRRADPPTVFILAWHQPAMTLGSGSFLTEIITRAGGRNLFAEEPRPSFVVSLEAVAARNPDFVLVTADGNDAAWAARPEWQAVRAVRERRFLRITGSEFSRPSPRVAQAVAALAAQLP